MAALTAILTIACNGDAGQHPPGESETAERLVSFATGGQHAATRVPFDPGTPVKIFVYNDTPGQAGVFGAAPYKTVTGEMGSAIDNLSEVLLTGGDINADGLLELRSGLVYHFIAVVDQTGGATPADIPSPVAGVIQPIRHGRDLLAARQTETLAYSATPAVIRFTQAPADNGNIPHLGSAIAVEAKASAALLTQQGNAVVMRVEGIDFFYCLPASAILRFDNIGSAEPFEIVPDGWNTAQVIDYSNPAVTLTTAADVAASGDAVILPYPLRNAGVDYNTLSVNFRFAAAGTPVRLEAPNVAMPPFRSGYRYKFIVEIEQVTAAAAGATLKLAIGPWNEAAWTGGIGGEPTDDILVLELGSWKTHTIHTGIGGEGNRDVTIFTVNPWYDKNWTAPIGN